jgi:hypothetical protein
MSVTLQAIVRCDHLENHEQCDHSYTCGPSQMRTAFLLVVRVLKLLPRPSEGISTVHAAGVPTDLGAFGVLPIMFTALVDLLAFGARLIGGSRHPVFGFQGPCSLASVQPSRVKDAPHFLGRRPFSSNVGIYCIVGPIRFSHPVITPV